MSRSTSAATRRVVNFPPDIIFLRAELRQPQLPSRDEYIFFGDVMRSGPAFQQGIRVGDAMIELNGKSLRGVGLKEFISLWTAYEGEAKSLTIQRAEPPPVEATAPECKLITRTSTKGESAASSTGEKAVAKNPAAMAISELRKALECEALGIDGTKADLVQRLFIHQFMQSGKRKREEDTRSQIEAITCPVCMDIVPSPVMQCQRGHVVCGVCKKNLPSPPKCPICRMSIETMSRNIICEKIIANVIVQCKFKDKGCEGVAYKDYAAHIGGDCSFGFPPCPCPLFGWPGIGCDCGWKGRSNEVAAHMESTHGKTRKDCAQHNARAFWENTATYLLRVPNGTVVTQSLESFFTFNGHGIMMHLFLEDGSWQILFRLATPGGADDVSHWSAKCRFRLCEPYFSSHPISMSWVLKVHSSLCTRTKISEEGGNACAQIHQSNMQMLARPVLARPVEHGQSLGFVVEVGFIDDRRA